LKTNKRKVERSEKHLAILQVREADLKEGYFRRVLHLQEKSEKRKILKARLPAIALREKDENDNRKLQKVVRLLAIALLPHEKDKKRKLQKVVRPLATVLLPHKKGENGKRKKLKNAKFQVQIAPLRFRQKNGNEKRKKRSMIVQAIAFFHEKNIKSAERKNLRSKRNIKRKS